MEIASAVILSGLMVVLEIVRPAILRIPLIVEIISMLILDQTATEKILMDQQGLANVAKRQILLKISCNISDGDTRYYF